MENNTIGVEELEDEKGPIAKKMLLGDDEVHVPQCEDTPTTLMQDLNELHKEEVGSLKKKLKIKVKSLKTVVKQLREKLLISSSCEEMF